MSGDDEVVEMLRKIGHTIEQESDAIRSLLGWILAVLLLSLIVAPIVVVVAV